jgi:hypothetical protein
MDVEVRAPAALAITQVTVGVDGHVSGTLGPISANGSFSAQAINLRAAPIDATKAELGGTLPDPYEWTTSDPGIASIQGDAHKTMVELVLGSSGSAVITVKSGTLTNSVTIKVM